MGNSSGNIIPKAMLVEIGVKAGDKVELLVQDGRLTIETVKAPSRSGWAEDAARIAAMADDALVMGEFGTDGGDDWTW